MAGVTTGIYLVFPSISAVDDGYEVQAELDASGSSFELQQEGAGPDGTCRRGARGAEFAQNWETLEAGTLVPYLLASSPIMSPVT